MATDDDVIRDSPYGAMVTMETINLSSKYERRINLSLVIQDADDGEYSTLGLRLYIHVALIVLDIYHLI